MRVSETLVSAIRYALLLQDPAHGYWYCSAAAAALDLVTITGAVQLKYCYPFNRSTVVRTSHELGATCKWLTNRDLPGKFNTSVSGSRLLAT
jgi:hypothetical protein